MAIVQWAGGPWGTMAMGNYPYRSSYLMHGLSLLPAWPVRQACITLDFEIDDAEPLFVAVRQAAARQSQITCIKMGQNLGLRCVLLSAPLVPEQTTSRI